MSACHVIPDGVHYPALTFLFEGLIQSWSMWPHLWSLLVTCNNQISCCTLFILMTCCRCAGLDNSKNHHVFLCRPIFSVVAWKYHWPLWQICCICYGCFTINSQPKNNKMCIIFCRTSQNYLGTPSHMLTPKLGTISLQHSRYVLNMH